MLVGDPFVQAIRLLGSDIICDTIGLDLTTASLSTALADGQMRLMPVLVPDARTINGVTWFQRTAGSYTADNTNGVALYSYSGGTLTLVADSGNVGTIWTAGANTFPTRNFTTPYLAQPGLYFVGLLYNQSAQTTAPALTGGTALGNAAMAAPRTGTSKLYGTVAATGFTASIAMSSISTLTATYWVGLI